MVGYVIEQINTSDLPPGTRAHALALLALCHHDNGHVAATWEALSHAMSVANVGTVRRHLGRMQAAGLIHYSSHGDGIVYVNFRAWHTATRAWVLPKPRVGATETVDPTRGQPPQLVVCLNNSSPLPPTTNQTNNHAPEPPETRPSGCAADPADAARSFALLVDVGVSPAKAKELAGAATFDAIRRQVAAWQPEFLAQRQGVGLLITRISEGWGAPPPPSAWWASELGRRHRTPAEIAEDTRTAEQMRELQAWQQSVVPPDEPDRSGYLDDDPVWTGLAAMGEPLLDKLAGLVEIAGVDGVTLYRFAARDAAFVSWLTDRGVPALRRRIASITGQPALVEVFA